jgi:hypothetical protein
MIGLQSVGMDEKMRWVYENEQWSLRCRILFSQISNLKKGTKRGSASKGNQEALPLCTRSKIPIYFTRASAMYPLMLLLVWATGGF